MALLDIGSTGAYPGCDLSNFAAHEFDFDGVHCASMEGFLQSLKFPDPETQVQVCAMTGIRAQRTGRTQDWTKHQKLYWKGKYYLRRSDEYQRLLDRAYAALYTNKDFRDALAATGNDTLTHTVGRSREGDTVLTIREFIHRLNVLRDRLHSEENMAFI